MNGVNTSLPSHPKCAHACLLASGRVCLIASVSHESLDVYEKQFLIRGCSSRGESSRMQALSHKEEFKYLEILKISTLRIPSSKVRSVKYLARSVN